MIQKKFTELYKKDLIDPPIYPGALINATITDINNNFVTVNAFVKSDGYIPISQFKNDKGILEIEIGNNVELVIDIVEDLTGEIKLSREKAKRLRAWEMLENIYKYDKIITGSVITKVKGGFTVKLDILKAFLPGSLISFRSTLEIDEIKGKDLKFKIIKLEKKKNNIVVSQKFMLEEHSGENLQTLITRLKEGTVVTGIIKNITDYGAFIDLGGIDGLLHITDMSWKRIKHPSDLIKIGNEIKIKVLKFDKNTNRVSLGLKQLTKDPWNDIRLKYKENMVVNGIVTNITDYGCFVEIEEGIEGLIHLSEMDWTNKNVNPKKIVKQGMHVKIIILDINTSKRRISLGLKQNSTNPWIIFYKNKKIGDIIKGKVKYITDFGVFIEINSYIDGLLHLSDISWKKMEINALLKRFKKGKTVKVKILAIDVDRERITLSTKQLTVNPFIRYIKKNKDTKFVTCKPLQRFRNDLIVTLTHNITGILKLTSKSIIQKPIKIKHNLKIKAKIIKPQLKNKKIYLEEIYKHDYYKTTRYKNNFFKNILLSTLLNVAS
ncbi:MAG TPA: 30S ribosomal protein S1 [Candidatus Azoamicus sp. OHIO2]